MTGRRDAWAVAFAKPSKLWRPIPSWKPHEWTPLPAALGRIENSGGYFEFAEANLHQDLVTGRMHSVLRLPLNNDSTKQLLRLLQPKFWQHLKIVGMVGLSDAFVEGDVEGRRLQLAGRLFFVRTADLNKHYPVGAAAQPARQSDLPPPRRRGPVVTHDWFSICGEIASRCVDPATGRVRLPKSENKLAEAVLDWLADSGQNSPAVSEMREAVKRVCARLREAQR
jgi:hypothetical protein